MAGRRRCELVIAPKLHACRRNLRKREIAAEIARRKQILNKQSNDLQIGIRTYAGTVTGIKLLGRGIGGVIADSGR